jgi:hypothetical protein
VVGFNCWSIVVLDYNTILKIKLIHIQICAHQIFNCNILQIELKQIKNYICIYIGIKFAIETSKYIISNYFLTNKSNLTKESQNLQHSGLANGFNVSIDLFITIINKFLDIG